MGVTTFQKKDYGVLDKHHVTPAYFYTLKFYAAAYEYANKAILVCSKDSTSALGDHYGTLADLYSRDGNHKEANINFKKALELEPDNYETQFFYGLSLCESGNVQDGIKHVKKSLELKPDFQDAKNFLNELNVKC